jgi:hypothetical protein
MQETKDQVERTNIEVHDIKINKKYISVSLRGQNYDLETALSELVDNSLDAGSTKIDITYPSKKDRESSTDIIIKDNGDGMSRSELMEAMNLGCDRPYDDNEIGYFGVGMKSSLAYLSETVRIITKRKDDSFYTELEWNVEKEASYRVSKVEDGNKNRQGTTIIINPGGRYGHYSHSMEYIITRRFGGRYYHLLNNKKLVRINVNNKEIQPADPMYRDEKHVEVNKCVDIQLPNGEFVKIHGYYLRNFQYDPNVFDSALGKKGFSSDRQGVYVLLNDRYINLGGTFLGVRKLHNRENYLRIEMEIPKSATEYFSISMNKNSLGDILSDEVHSDVTKEAVRAAIKTLSSWGMNKDDMYKTSTKSTDEDRVHEADEISKKINNKLNQRGIKKSPLDNPNISEKIPVVKKENKEKVENTDEKKETKKSDKKRKRPEYKKNLMKLEYYNGSPVGEIWELRRDGSKLVIRLNEDHTFCKVFLGDDVPESQKMSMIELLYSFACAQYNTYGDVSYIPEDKVTDFWNQYWFDASRAIKRVMED